MRFCTGRYLQHQVRNKKEAQVVKAYARCECVSVIVDELQKFGASDNSGSWDLHGKLSDSCTFRAGSVDCIG